ncbi:MAG: flagellar hook-length control protein FliK [Roseiarcus sp.]
MTAAPAVAPAPAPVAPLPARAAPQPSADHFAFATVLDSLPRAAAKAGTPAAEEQARPSNESPQEQSSRGQAAHHSLPNDSAFFASLPFALRAASMMEERPQAADNSPSVASAAVTGPKSDDSGGSIAAGASTSSVGRLIGERAFHFGSSTSEGALASRTLTTGAPFGAAEAISATPLAGAVPPVANAMAPAQIASPAPPSSNRPSLTRAASHEAAHSATKPEGSAPPPATRASESASPPAPAGSNAKAVDDRLPDPTPSAAPSPTQTSLFGAQLLAPFGVGASFEPDASATKAAGADVAPPATPLAAGSASSAQPVKEIDVDLSPGGLEDVSMTMRLAGDKLSVVIRAASSQTLGSIEGARDAITDRLAAIGQPLDSLIVKQAGVNTNANTNGNPASTEDGSTGEAGRSAQGASEWGGSNDALSRRGAGRDRSF